MLRKIRLKDISSKIEYQYIKSMNNKGIFDPPSSITIDGGFISNVGFNEDRVIEMINLLCGFRDFLHFLAMNRELMEEYEQLGGIIYNQLLNQGSALQDNDIFLKINNNAGKIKFGFIIDPEFSLTEETTRTWFERKFGIRDYNRKCRVSIDILTTYITFLENHIDWLNENI